MQLVLLIVNCEEDKDRFQKGVEKDLIALIQQKVIASLKWNMRLLFKE